MRSHLLIVAIGQMFYINVIHAFAHRPRQNNINRSTFISRLIFPTITTTIMPNQPSNAIEFVPPSPYFSGTYADAIEILNTQRLAVDNIATVLKDGSKLDEASFKIMQLNSQTRMAGKIVLGTFQEGLSSAAKRHNREATDVNILLLRYISCQKKLAILLDILDECEASMYGTTGSSSAALQVKMLDRVDATKNAYDDFLMDVSVVEKGLL